MIVITRLNGTQFAINPDLIERCYASPDTHVTMVEGTTYIITETVDELIELIAAYRAPSPGPRRHVRRLKSSAPLPQPTAMK